MKQQTDIARRADVAQLRARAIADVRVAVIGLGYVGLPLALRANHRGHPVIGFDIQPDHVENIRRRLPPDFLSGQDAEVLRAHDMRVSTDDSVLSGADIFVICVPTPVLHNHEPDLGPLISAVSVVAPHLKKGNLVVVESTVNPGVSDEIVLPMLRKLSGLSPEKDFYYAYCPERINPGDTKWDVRSIPRVLGASGPKSSELAFAFYSNIVDAPIHLMQNVKEAEAVKITENSFRDINIAFVNELAMSFKKLDIDVVRVINGAATKPFAFMAHYPGCGVGGHCIPVDPYYLISYARQNGFAHRFLQAARDINNHMPFYTVSLLEQALHEKGIPLHEARVALLGLTYKKNVPDDRESPSFTILQELLNRGTSVETYDPYLLEQSTVESLDEALLDADAVLIATDHDLFTALTPTDLHQHGATILIDGRNCLDKDAFVRAGITYHGIGR